MTTSSLFLVTGGTSFIGSHLVERLLAEGRCVRVLDNFSTGSRANLAFARGNRRLEVIRGDLASLKVVERAVRGVARYPILRYAPSSSQVSRDRFR